MWEGHSCSNEEGELDRTRRTVSAVIPAEGDGDLDQSQAWLGVKIKGILVTDWMRMRRQKEG